MSLIVPVWTESKQHLKSQNLSTLSTCIWIDDNIKSINLKYPYIVILDSQGGGQATGKIAESILKWKFVFANQELDDNELAAVLNLKDILTDDKVANFANIN